MKNGASPCYIGKSLYLTVTYLTGFTSTLESATTVVKILSDPRVSWPSCLSPRTSPKISVCSGRFSKSTNRTSKGPTQALPFYENSQRSKAQQLMKQTAAKKGIG